ncbi:hypothetical protein ACSBR1_033994 [Camellia fascicularis]
MASSASFASSLSSSIPLNLTLLISNLSPFVTIKLDSSNFIIWKSQMSNILRATNLLGYVNGTVLCPHPTVKDANGIKVLNTKHVQWNLIDAHLLSCLTISLSPSIYSTIFQYHHCSEIWSSLHENIVFVEDEDVVLLTLNGLTYEFAAFKTTI